MLQRQKLPRLLGLVEQFDRRLEAQTLEAAHQRFITEHRPGGDLGDRLEGIFDRKLRQRKNLVVTKAAQRQHFGRDGGQGGHAKLRADFRDRAKDRPEA